MNYYPRKLLSKIEPFYKLREIIAIVGARQVGKTTLLKIIFDHLSKKHKCLFLTFENRSDLEIFDTDIENFKKLYCLDYEIIFIDEFQYAKDAGQKLKYLYDTTKVKFFISGSASLQIKEAGKYLVGRVFTFDLHSFSFEEYLEVTNPALYHIVKKGFNIVKNLLAGNEPKITNFIKSEALNAKLTNLFEQYLIFGGYPRVVTSKTDDERKQVLASIIDNYLLRDISSLLHLATENQLLNLSRFLSLQTGNLISYTELSTTIGMPYKEVKNHIKILEQTFVVNLVYPYFGNRRTELVKNPKVYFLDNGFRNKVIDNFSSLSDRSDMGALAENFIFNSLIRGNIIDSNKVNFWRTKSQAEVDFIVFREGEIIPVEVKYAPINQKVAGKSLFSFINKYSPKTAVITTNKEFGARQIKNTNLYFIPIFFLD
ncbi:MAG: ATP-binding protein [Candidatus Levyibacteriota bacterium]|nr:MAG: ATP-binding protein [Candidatus Levybacteria bacterium]